MPRLAYAVHAHFAYTPASQAPLAIVPHTSGHASLARVVCCCMLMRPFPPSLPPGLPSRALVRYALVQKAMKDIGFSDDVINDLHKFVAATVHLGRVDFDADGDGCKVWWSPTPFPLFSEWMCSCCLGDHCPSEDISGRSPKYPSPGLPLAPWIANGHVAVAAS